MSFYVFGRLVTSSYFNHGDVASDGVTEAGRCSPASHFSRGTTQTLLVFVLFIADADEGEKAALVLHGLHGAGICVSGGWWDPAECHTQQVCIDWWC